MKFTSILNVEEEQRVKLFNILDRNKSCEYGRIHGFDSIKSISEYQSRVPLTTFEDYKGYLEKIKKGEKSILTSEDILLLEPTSGSTSASKLIPYTKHLKADFQCGLKPWVYNLYSGYKGIKWGKSYWSVTPAASKKEYTEGGIPIGFEEDSEYFGNIEKKLMDFLFAVPSSVAREENMDEFYHKTAVYLLKCRNLTLVSVWNPTFFMLLLDYMQKNADMLANEISTKSRRRGLEVRDALSEKAYDRLWSELKVISCWCDANAATYAGKLKASFPGVEIQPKGLLATEGFISLPFAGENGARLSIKSHFFEFISVADGEIYLAHELEQGKEYSVVITTSGGLYRYKLNDIIEVTGFSGVFPLVRFKGKQDKVSDLFGEKLNEQFVKDVLEKLVAEKSGIQADFYMVAPETDRYVLYIKTNSGPTSLGSLPMIIDTAFRENFHYDYCRKLGQLKELRLFRLTGNPAQEYLDECVKRGQRLGDIKPAVLHLQGSWDKIFKGEYL